MADNTADYTKKILVDIELKADQVKKDLPAILKEIQDLTDAQKVLEVQGKKNSSQWVNNATSIRQLKGEVREINKTIDNTTKAINAENNSIAQNRALLSLLTAEHVKLGQANGDSKAKIAASAKTINDLTTVLKDQEKAIGQTYRNVGNYEDAIISASNALGGILPGFQQFGASVRAVAGFAEFLPKAMSSAGDSIAQFGGQISNFVGFKSFEKDAEGAVETVKSFVNETKEVGDGLSEAQAGVEQFSEKLKESGDAAKESGEGGKKAGAGFKLFDNILKTTIIGAIIGLVLLLVNYLKSFDPLMDILEQAFAGFNAALNFVVSSIKNVFTGLTSLGDLIKGFGNFLAHPIDSMKSFGNAMAQAAKDAATLKKAQQDLEDTIRINEVKTAETQQRVAELILRARNKVLNNDQKKKYLDEAAALDKEDFNRRTDQANEELRIATENLRINGRLDEQQLARVKKRGLAEILELQGDIKVKGKITDAEIDMYKKAQLAIISAKDESTKRQEKIQNKIDADAEKAQAEAERAADKAADLKQKKIDAALEADNILKASLTKELQAIYDNYGDQVLAADQHYNDEITKLKKFRDKKLITQAQYNRVETQLTKEHAGEVQRIIEQFNREDLESYRQATNDLINLRIQNINDDTKRTIAGLKQRGVEQEQELSKQNDEHIRTIKALDVEIANLAGAEKAAAQDRRNNEISLIELNENKRIAIAKSTAKQIEDVNRKATRDRQAAEDEAAVLKAKRGTGLFNNGGAQSAEMQAIANRYDFEISEAARAGKSTVLLEQQKIDALKAINDQYRNEKIAYAYEAEQMVQGAVFDILSQGLQQQSEAKLNQLNQNKAAELNNTSLTNTEKRLIEQKYKKLEDAEKLRAFKANQKLQAANILINGAVGISKTIAEMGFLPAIPFVALTVASTALQIGKVLSAKPGFADGGEFKSDGKGALLPGYSRKDNTNAYLRSGEAVVVSEAMRAPWARNIVSDINVMFGGRSFASPGHQKAFATGGVFTDGGNANRYYSAPVYDSEALANSLAYQLINNFPNVYVDVKDINNQQSIRAQTIDRVDL